MEPWARLGKRVRGISLTAERKSSRYSLKGHSKRTKQKTDILALILANMNPMAHMNRIPFYRKIFRSQGK
jgi:hypothetical protein